MLLALSQSTLHKPIPNLQIYSCIDFDLFYVDPTYLVGFQNIHDSKYPQ